MIKNKIRSESFLITGSSSGIGRAIADELADKYKQVIYHGKSKKIINLPNNCKCIFGDLSNESVVENLFKQIINEYDIEGIICCAGRTHLSNTDDNPALIKVEDFIKILNNIFICTLLTCQKFIPYFINRKKGKIIIIGGDIVDKPNEKSEMCGYAVSKAAVHQYALYLSNYLRPYNISVNVVAPTSVFRDECNYDKKSLLRKALKKEIANVVSFICKEESFINGQIIRINGGRTTYFKP